MKKGITFALTMLIAGGFILSLSATRVTADPAGPPIPEAIWADGHLFGTVLTPSDLPDKGPKDGIYNFMGQAGQQSVAEAKPGDADYNGGRWNVTLVSFTEAGLAEFDQDMNGEVDEDLTSWEEVQQAISDGYVAVDGPGPTFVCPLIP